MTHDTTFDSYAVEYDAALAYGLAVSGEDKNYFARGRVNWLAGQLGRLDFRAGSVLDFGCGTGSATPFLREAFGDIELVGVDTSAKSLEVARRVHGAVASFASPAAYTPRGAIDLAFCNGVFHHIALSERAEAMGYIWRALRPGGLFALWENNPWNPGTRLVMRRCAFDRDAITLAPPATRRLAREAGFEVLDTRFLFIFPRLLRGLRGLEPHLARLPLGAQYQTLCRKPACFKSPTGCKP